MSIVLFTWYTYTRIDKKLKDGPTIVIGNGPSLAGKGLGRTIDSFTNIIRINKFKTKGYENDVGTRTTGWGLNQNLGIEYIKNKIKVDNFNPEWIGCRKSDKLGKYFPQLEKYTSKFSIGGCTNFTSGTLAILHILESGINPVYVAGISGTSGAYYFDDSPETIKRNKKNIKKYHCDGVEQKLLKKLIMDKKIISLDGGI